MSLRFQRGAEAIKAATESRGSGDFTPFLPNFYWKDDKQTRLLWILNPLEDIPTVQMIKPYTTEKRVELVVARQDDAIGESSDPIEDEWGYGPAFTGVCIAVELTAVKEVRNGRERPVSFEVATREFKRRIRDEDGELTEEKEDAVAPAVGVICQSPNNFFNHLASKDSSVGPINLFPMQVQRNGDDKDTDYEFELFEEKPLDMSGLLENWEGISYLTEDEKDEIATLLDEAEDEHEEASIIGAALLDKWLNAHASEEFYNEVASKIDSPAKYPSKRYQEKKGETKGDKKKDRASRPSQRRGRHQAEPEEAPETTDAEETQAEETVEEQPRRQRRQRRSKETTTATETASEDSGSEEEQPSVKAQVTSVRERMNSLKAQNAERAKAKAA